MLNRKEMKAVAKRAERYWFEDGIWEIGFGLVCILLGGFYLLVEQLEQAGGWVVLVQMAVLIGAFLGMGRLVKYLKERITYPRTGFVAYLKPALPQRVKRIALTALLAASMAALVGAAASIQLMRNTTALVTGILLAGALVYLGYRFGLARLYFLAGLTALLGYVSSLLPLPDFLVTAGFFAGFGLLMTISGLLTLRFYLAHTQPAGDTDWEQEA